MEPWQEKLTSISNRLSHIFSHGYGSDVTFIVGKQPIQERFKLHKLILSMSSDVFFKMFYGSLEDMIEIKVPDIQPDIFKITMKYIYEDAFLIQSMEQATSIYLVAERYNIVHLWKLCADYINDNLCPASLQILYKTPILLESSSIKTKLFKILSEKTLDIVRSDSFLKASFDMVKDMIQLDDLNIESEEELFDFVLEWAKSFCSTNNSAYSKEDLRSVMDHFLPHIRFLTMNAEAFILGPAKRRVLTGIEVDSISKNLVVSNCQELLPLWCNKRKSRNLMPTFRLIKNHSCRFTESLFDIVACQISISGGDITFSGVSTYVFGLSDFISVWLEVKNCCQDTVTCHKNEWSYDSKTFLSKCTLLKPVVLDSTCTYEIYLTSDHYIFKRCCVPCPGINIKKNGDFEVKCSLLNSDDDGNVHIANNGSSAKHGCIHFYEIFYS